MIFYKNQLTREKENKFYSKNNRRGFTLIELLVVIAIIGILSSVVLVSLNKARSKARDAKRISDLHTLSTAIELAYDDNDRYTTTSSGWISTTDNILYPILVTAGYLPSLPVPPGYSSCVSTGDSCYMHTGSSETYCFYTKLEKAPETDDPHKCSGSSYCASYGMNYMLCN